MNQVSKVFKKYIEDLENKYFDSKNTDKWRLNFHLMPPIGWLNDPNGLSYFKGQYNIFFQYSPFDVNGGLKFWGFYKSIDLINYEYIGASLYPDENFDCHGVYSGSSFIEDEKLYIYYTGNVKLAGEHDYINSGRESNTILVISDDAINFSSKQCIMYMKDYPDGITNHIRDPKVWKENNKYYMVQGVRKNTKPDNRGAVLIFSSDDKFKWEYLHSIDTNDIFGYMWECPDLFELDGQNILITCPQGVPQLDGIYENIYLCGYFLLNDDYKNNDCKVNDFIVLDRGFDFYAPQTFLDQNNNRVLIGWMGVPDTEEYHKNLTVDHGWQHCLTVPRELSFKNGKLYQKPHRSLEKLRADKIAENDYSNNDFSENLIDDNINSYEIIINNRNNDELNLLISEGLCFKYKNNNLILEFIDKIENSIGGGRKKRSACLQSLNNIRILIDTSSVEIFVNEGEIVFSTRFYPNINSFRISGNLSFIIYKLNSFNIKYK